MITFIKEHREMCGVEPICRVLQIAPSTFYAHLAVGRDPDKASDRAKRDAELRPEMKRVWEENLEVYGARKLWHAMKREKFDIARCTVERLMRDIGIKGVRRGKKIKTTWPDKALPSPLDRVNRQFRATMPNQLWGKTLFAIGSRTMVERFYLRLDLARLCLCGLCHRYFCQQDRWLARIKITANTVCFRCFGTGAL